MHFVCALSQTEAALKVECPHTIFVPPAIQSDTLPWSSPWRWGDRSLNVACLLCSRVYEYSKLNSQWEWVGSNERLETLRKMGVHLLSVPCGVAHCSHLIEILIPASPESGLFADDETLMRLWVRMASCGNGHRTTFRVSDRSPRKVCRCDDFQAP
jgi:hypothetical protein